MTAAPQSRAELLSLVEEAERRVRETGRHSYVPCVLHAKQRAFLALEHLEALYGGAAGGGKTEALLADVLRFVGRPGFHALVLRRTFRELNLPGSIMHRAIEWVGRELWNDLDKRFTFPGGAILQFGYCESESDLARYKSAQFHRIVVDEITEWREKWFAFLFSRIRRKAGDTIPLGMRAATNPDGVGADWVRRRFGIEEGEVVTELREHEDRAFLPARAEDNPSLDLASYDAALRKLGPVKYKQLRWGQWLRDGEGLVYGDFDPTRNEVETPPTTPEGTPPYEWTHIVGVDFGVVDPTAFAVLAWRRGSRVVYVLESYARAQMSVTEAAEELKALLARYPASRVVGDVGGMGKAFEVEFRRRHSLPIEPAEKHNKNGYISLLNAAFREGLVKLIAPKCKPLRAEMDGLGWVRAEGNQPKEDPGFSNHCTDAMLYGWRAAYGFAEREPPPEPAPDVKQRQELDAFFARDEASRQTKRGREWWDDGTDSFGGGFGDE